MMQQLLLQFYTSQNPFSAVSSAAVPGRYWMCCQCGGNRRAVSGCAKRSSKSNTTPLSCGVRTTRPAACSTLFMPG